jgi:hypothetical protein
MRRAIPLVFALTLFATACSSESSDDSVVEIPTTESSSTSTLTPTSVVPDTTMSEVAGGGDPSPLVIVAVDFEAGFILIRNDGDDDYDLAGHWICNRPTYSELPGDVLAPGTTIEIDTAAIGLDADSGEIALYVSSDFGSADDILRYVQWGTDSHGRTAVAVAGGVWQNGDFVDNKSANIESTGSDPVSASDWSSN